MSASIQINYETGQGSITHGPNENPQVERFFTKRGAYDSVQKLRHTGSITNDEKNYFEREIAKTKDPVEAITPSIYNLTHVLGGVVVEVAQ